MIIEFSVTAIAQLIDLNKVLFCCLFEQLVFGPVQKAQPLDELVGSSNKPIS